MYLRHDLPQADNRCLVGVELVRLIRDRAGQDKRQLSPGGGQQSGVQKAGGPGIVIGGGPWRAGQFAFGQGRGGRFKNSDKTVQHGRVRLGAGLARGPVAASQVGFSRDAPEAHPRFIDQVLQREKVPRQGQFQQRAHRPDLPQNRLELFGRCQSQGSISQTPQVGLMPNATKPIGFEPQPRDQVLNGGSKAGFISTGKHHDHVVLGATHPRQMVLPAPLHFLRGTDHVVATGEESQIQARIDDADQ